MVQATAPGKIILFGEHAVVYGQPAIAAPVSELRATATVEPSAEAGVKLVAPDLNTAVFLHNATPHDPIAAAVRQLQTALDLPQLPNCTLTVTSQIPIASGMGSGAAISAAIIRALAQFLGKETLLTNDWVSAQTYEVEKLHHGTPSGIDNTVVTYEQPVYFVRQQPANRVEPFSVAQPLRLLIADTGIASRTKIAVGDVRRGWEADRAKFEKLFVECGQIAEAARTAVSEGDFPQIGRLMNENHALLQAMTVSSAELDQLVRAARAAGSSGAKLSGAGRGGNMIALIAPEQETAVSRALRQAGATHVRPFTLR